MQRNEIEAKWNRFENEKRTQNGNDAKTNQVESQTKGTENEIDSNGYQTKRKHKRNESDPITNQLGIEKRQEYIGFLNRRKRDRKTEDFIRRPTQWDKKQRC